MAKDYISLDYSNKNVYTKVSEENEDGLYFGKNALDEMKMYIENKFTGQKIIVLCTSLDFENISDEIYSENYDACIISVVDYNNAFIDRLKSALEDVNLIVGIGDDRLINLVKAVSCRYDKEYVLYFNRVCGYKVFINEYYLEDNFSLYYEVKSANRIYIDEDKVGETDRNIVACRAFEVFNRLGYFADYVLNFIVYKSEYNIEFVNEFKKIYKSFYNGLDKLIMMDKEAINKLQDCIIELAFLLKKIGYLFNYDKENMFSSIYKYFDREDTSNALVESVGFRVMLSIYTKFINNINIQSTYFNIEKHVAMFDKYFRNINVKLELEAMPEFRKLEFVLTKAKDDIICKLSILNKMTDLLFNKCIKILPDNGYELSNKLNTNLVERSVYFCSDIVKGDCYLKIIRDFGILDYDIE